MEKQNYCGMYYMMGFLLIVKEMGGELVVVVPGAPDGYEILLEALGGDSFRMRGGLLDGSVAVFAGGDSGKATTLRVGNFELARVAEENAYALSVVERFPAPPLELTAEKQAAFQALLNEILPGLDGVKIYYSLPYPKHEFVRYVMAQDAVIFHGSNNREIEVFSPVRNSVELYDKAKTGNLQAVYGSHDGLWAMFFAIVNRSQLQGSIRNGVIYVHNRAGEALALYHFSVNRDQLADRPWTPGTLYFLPRASFERQRLTEASYANEWACPTEVRPLARLDVDPEDFPFLEQIGGHDDSFLIRADALGKAIREAALAARLEGARLEVRVPRNAELEKTLAEWVEMQREVIPAAQFRVGAGEAELTLVIDDLPPAHRQVFEKQWKINRLE